MILVSTVILGLLSMAKPDRIKDKNNVTKGKRITLC
jgi:hypothetical protein|tara:strand:+ start:4514 stop:4621 length:108 start_codon:yes stop_codon:yes gene_type:complete